MITADQAEKLAHDTVEAYINKCGCKSLEDVGRVLMKLASMTGLALVATHGQEDAIAIVESVSRHIAQSKFSGKVRVERTH